ncbi:MAG: LegC family aminotransferase [Legionellales bacterium]
MEQYNQMDSAPVANKNQLINTTMALNHEPLCADFLAALQQVLGAPSQTLSLHEPEFKGNELAYITECIETGWVSSLGKYVDSFEQRLAEYTGAKHAIAVVNGTAALHVALLLAGVKPLDEVLVPALSFVATANAVSHCGAIPHFVDSNAQTLGLDAERLLDYLNLISEPCAGGLRNRQTKRRIAAIVPMHTFGHPMDMDALLAVSSRFKIPIVEDAAESLGSFYRGQHTGTFGLLGTLSFNGNKIITCGGGGAILTNDTALARQAKHLTTTAKQPHPWLFYHDEIAYNYRMPNLNAALGCAQLEQLPDFLMRKRLLAGLYRQAFAGVDGIHFVDEPAHTQSNFWLNTVRVDACDVALRDALLTAAHQKGYACRPAWECLNQLPMYKNNPQADVSTALALQKSLCNLPSTPALGS